ncbi:MAG: hypothetical protein ACLUGH_03675 [Oscillospiraceae bacterium]
MDNRVEIVENLPNRAAQTPPPAVIYKKNNDAAAHSLQHAKKYCIMIKDF